MNNRSTSSIGSISGSVSDIFLINNIEGIEREQAREKWNSWIGSMAEQVRTW